MSDALLLAIDIGTSACKADAFTSDGVRVCGAEATYPLYSPGPGYAEQDAEDWWQGACAAVRKILESVDPSRIAAVGIDGQSWAAIAVDGKGNPLCRTPIWKDMRAQKQCDAIMNSIGEERLFECSGNPCTPSYTLPKVLWYRNELPEVYAKAEKILQSNGYIAMKLTGTITQDLSQGYGWQCFNMAKGSWDESIISELELRKSLLPDLCESSQIIGTVTKEASGMTGLLEGTPVVAGGLDAACGTLGVGVLHPGQTQEQGGQAGGMSICVKDALAHKKLILSRHVTGDSYLLQGGTVGGSGALRWMKDEFCAGEVLRAEKEGTDVFSLLSEMAASVPAGSEGLAFLPYLSGERSPIWNPKAKGVLYGMDFSKTRAHLVRACMEGVAYSLQHNCKTAEEAGAFIQSFRATGGAAKSKTWLQIKADITGKALETVSAGHETTLGAAMVAGVGVGIYADFEEAADRCVHVGGTVHPNPENAQVYREGYGRYLRLYEQLCGIMNEG